MTPNEQAERLRLAADEVVELLDLLNDLGKLQEFIRLAEREWETFVYEDIKEGVRIEMLLKEYLSTAHCLLDEIRCLVATHRETITGEPHKASDQFYVFEDNLQT